MRLLQWLLWSCIAVAAAHEHAVAKRDAVAPARVVCYYTNWSVYRPGTAKFSPQNINPYLCTHLIYAFGGLSRENGLRPYDKYQDIEQGGYAKFTGLKTYNKQLKTLLAIGGWNEGSARFSSLVADEERRGEFVKNAVRFLRQNHFDGLDLDWEYPAFRDGGKPRDRDNYGLLVQELREEFDREHSKTGRPRLLLTMAVPAGIEYIDKGYDIPKLNRYLDFMNILSYDYHSAFEPSVNHHSPLYPLEEENEYNFDTQLCIDFTVKHLIKQGADRDKLVLGIPTYGRSYTLFNPEATEIGAPADGPGEQGDATREKGYLAYYEICENLEKHDWQVEKPNPSAMGPYAYKDNQWVGYDDEDIVRLKAKYVTENGLGGVMFWAIDNDDFRGKCHGRPYPLIEAGKEAMLTASGLTNEVSAAPPQTKKGPQRPRQQGSSGGRSRGRKRKNKGRTSTTTSTTTTRRTTTASTTTPKYVTPEPPTTPDPGSDFKCKDEGFFPHPRDCKKYFWCLDSGPSNLGIVAHQFTCPSGLVFNKAADSCDYSRNVVCKTKSKAETTTTKAPTTTTTTAATRTTRSTTTTTTTTTTTPPPDEDEYEEYEDEEDEEGGAEAEEEDPKVIQELINLIKKLGGVEQLERQLQLQEKTSPGGTSGISRSLYNKVLGRTTSSFGRGAALYGTTTPSSKDTSTRYSSVFRSRSRGPQNEGLEETPTKFERPKYVTIQRNRPSTVTPEEEEDEDLDDDDYELVDEDEEEAKPEVSKPETTKTSAREYVNIRRERPHRLEESDVTTPKYTTIQRQKSPAEEVNEPAAQETPKATAVNPDIKSGSEDEFPAPSQDTALENPPKDTPASKRPSRLNVINKKGRKDEETVQEVEKETEAPIVKVSGERRYIDAASIRSGPEISFFQTEQGENVATFSLANDPLPTTQRQPSEVTVDQVSDIPLLNNYLDTTRFRTTSEKLNIYLDDQSIPSISPIPHEYASDGGDDHEVNIVVARSPAPVTSQINYIFSPNSTSLPLTTPALNVDYEGQRHSSAVETFSNERFDSVTTGATKPTEEAIQRRRSTTIPTTTHPSSTTPLEKTFPRHSFLPRRRSTTTTTSTAATTTSDQVSLSTSDYSRNISPSFPRQGLRPQNHFFPKLRRNSTGATVNAIDILTPSPVTTESSNLTYQSNQDDITHPEIHIDIQTLADREEDFANLYLTTTETQLDKTFDNLNTPIDTILKPTAWLPDSQTARASYPQKSITEVNNVSFHLLSDTDFNDTSQKELFENNREHNVIITDNPKLWDDNNKNLKVTDYDGLSPDTILENATEQNTRMDELTSTKDSINSLLPPNYRISPISSQEEGKEPDDSIFNDPLTSSEENASESTKDELRSTMEQSFMDEQRIHLQDTGSTTTTTTTTTTPTESDYDSETTLPTAIETVPPPTTTRFTPTVTRVVTSVTESGTTERQRIAVNRVPYRMLIAALREKQLTPPGNTEQFETTTVPTYYSDSITDINLAPATTPEPSTSRQRFRYITTADVFSGPPETKVEKIMEVNRITTVTVKQETQVSFTKYFTREQTTIHPNVQDTLKSDLNETNKYKNELSENTFTLDDTMFITTEAEVVPKTEQNGIEHNGVSVSGTLFPVLETDVQQLRNSTYSELSDNRDITADLTTEGTSTTSSTTPVSTFVNRARTRSPGFRRRTTERASVSNGQETLPSVNGYRKPLRSRSRQYKPSTTVAPKETEDPLLVKLRRGHRPVNASRLDGSTARKPGSFSRRRVYRPSSTTETPSTEEFNSTDEATENRDGSQISYTRGRVYRPLSRSTTEKEITSEVLATTGRNYSGIESSTTVDVPFDDSLVSLQTTIVSVIEAESPAISVFIHNNMASTQRIPESESKYVSQEEADKVSTEKLPQENYFSDSPTEPFKNATAGVQLGMHDISGSTYEAEHTTRTQEVSNISLEINKLSTQESPTLLQTEATIVPNDVTQKSSTEESRVRYTETSVATFTEEIASSSRPRLVSDNNTQEIHNVSYIQATTNKLADENEPTARPHRKKMVVKKRRRRPTEGTLAGAEDNKKNEVNELVRNYKEDRDVIHEKGESLAVLEDTNRNFISTESSLSAELFPTAEDNNDQYVKLSILNKLNHPLPPGQVPVTGSGYLETSDYSDYDKYPSKEIYDSKTTSDPGARFTSRFVYSSSETSNEVQDETGSRSEPPTGQFPSRKTNVRPPTPAYAEVTETPPSPGGRGSSRFQSQAKTFEKAHDITRRRKVVRKKRPEAVADAEVTDEEASLVNITARPLGRQRQPGTLFSPRQRQRATTAAPAATTTPATLATTRQPAGAQRRVVKRRKFGPRGQVTTEPTSPAASESAPPTQEDATAGPARRLTFPRRRVVAAASTTTTPPSDAAVQPSAVVEDTRAPAAEAAALTELPDLAHPAVAAIAHLATQPPPTSLEKPTSARAEEDEVGVSAETTSLESTATASTTRTPESASPSSSAKPPRIPSAVRRLVSKSTTTTPSVPATTSTLRRQPLKPRPFVKIASSAPKAQPSPATSKSVANPSRSTPPPRPPPQDYDYYDDASIAEAGPGGASSKVRVHDDGYIECLDQGNFPHPYSCKKFISCAKMESGGLLGWEYTCPRQLSFDPVGGICNWSAGLGCKE